MNQPIEAASQGVGLLCQSGIALADSCELEDRLGFTERCERNTIKTQPVFDRCLGAALAAIQSNRACGPQELVFQMARQLQLFAFPVIGKSQLIVALELYRECEKINAKSHLKDQLSRASLSVVLNLSEGSAKESVKDRRRFYSIALASLRESQSLLEIVSAQKPVLELADQTGACIYRLVHALDV